MFAFIHYESTNLSANQSFDHALCFVSLVDSPIILIHWNAIPKYQPARCLELVTTYANELLVF